MVACPLLAELCGFSQLCQAPSLVVLGLLSRLWGAVEKDRGCHRQTYLLSAWLGGRLLHPGARRLDQLE